MGWVKGLEPSALGTTIRCSNPVSYTHLVCVSSENAVPPELKTLAAHRYIPCLTTLFKSPENGKLLADCSPFTADYPIPPSGRLWYLCENGACKPPETDFKDLKL